MSSSLNDISTRLNKYDTIIQQLTTNINLLSQEKIAEHKERSVKTPKRPSPYEQTSYRASKNRYNLRGNKQGNITADDSEQPMATDEDTDAPDEAVMSDGAVFEGIIDELSNTTPTETKFSVKSYNPLNLLPQFNATHNNDTPTICSRNYIREPRNDEDENMLNYIEHHLFDDQDTIESTSSTSQIHDTPISTSSQLRTQFIDYHKFGLHQYSNIDMDLKKTTHSVHSFSAPNNDNDNIIHNIHFYTDDKGITKANAVDDKELIIKCYKEIENILITAKHNHFECIVLGDLNISFDKLKKSNHYPIWRREIKTIFKNFGLKDLLKSFHDHPSPTHTTKRNDEPDIQTRIDYIFTSPNILHYSFYAYTHNVSEDFFTTDHQALSCYLTQDYFKNKSNSSRKSLEKSPTYKPNTDPKIQFKYHLMTTESWSNYKITNGIIYRKHLNNKPPLPDITPEQQIELYWSNIKNIIQQTKDQCIPFSTYKKYTKHDRPLSLRQNNNKILILRMILRRFSNIKINRLQGDLDKWTDYWNTWDKIRKQILVIDVHFNAKRTIWLPYTLTPDNISDVKKDLQSLLRISIVLHKQEEDSWTINKINRYINDRNNNLIHNQKRMINSILDRKPQKITLDRLHYYDHQTNQFQFTNNPHIIAEQTNLHFQRLGKDLNELNEVKKYKSIRDLPLYWRSSYEPINNRDCKHMTSLVDEFSIEELSQVISSLPNNKAAGISGITYEDIKHTHQDFREYINKFFNYIMQVQIYPRDWLHAFLFPIPKPKAWDCKIENTRPIVLLETFRKLFVKILIQRINTTLTTYNLINENNRAGLTGQSTLQPLQVVQHIIESAYKDKKQLWIGLQDLSKAYDRVNLSLLRLALERLHFPNAIITLLISLFSDRKNNVILPFGLSADFDVLQDLQHLPT
ncbi:unnamed protein product [Rhizophagus irregularis]|uniref:Reverse transcriptase domain-containing protein n=1 Tax=Rhizophagus irregularis TaxID=588596 RepID=A0A915ZQ44_9GLOM|nr:unnamed protein product [Rhizophagus irregularis]